ncbi:MAG TPA: CxxxxCH/CxxCH domain-containing protein, partial [Geobacteraceae bacterium]|nr:CxxxxCH/CxxCH domain-containing protein [Geobacteraceae bacterium]
MPYPRTLALLLFSALCSAAPATAGDCLGCHGDVAGQLQGSSHHIQGVSPSGKHCYACHWEATANGDVDERHHQRDTARIDLVIWKDGARPVNHIQGDTAATFSSKAIGTGNERTAFAGITRHCLSCHNGRTGTLPTFEGDGNTPGKYAWDGSSIDSRYSDKGGTTWGKYSTQTSNRKMQVKKAFSAHGNAIANEGGWSPSEGYDGRIPNSRKGGVNVECFDCHNSHGSNISGVTSSYRTADGTFGGGILKETIGGRGGYAMTYVPTANSDTKGKNPYNPGAGLCFDCHETASAGSTPWGYLSTFGAEEPVMGYKDTHRFGPGVKGSTSRYANRQGRA